MADAPRHRLAVSLVAQCVLAQVDLLLPLRQAVRICLALRFALWPTGGCSKADGCGEGRAACRGACNSGGQAAQVCIPRGGPGRDSRSASSTTKSAVTSLTPLMV